MTGAVVPPEIHDSASLTANPAAAIAISTPGDGSAADDWSSSGIDADGWYSSVGTSRFFLELELGLARALTVRAASVRCWAGRRRRGASACRRSPTGGEAGRR